MLTSPLQHHILVLLVTFFEKNATADVNASSKYPNEFFLRILKLNYNYNLKIKKKLKVHEFSNYARSRW